MPKPLLPSLKDNNKIAITKRGQWQSEAQNTLGNLVEDLKVTADHQSTITSIPNLWARPAMYEMVLFTKDHHLHKKYLGEWRGILAMLALSEIRGFKSIKCEEIIVPDITKMRPTALSFLQVLARQLPADYKDYIDDTVSGGDSKIQLLTFEGKPLAIIWPSILLCPAVGLNKHVDRSVSWWSFDGINDPVNSLSDKEKALLSKWIDGVIDSYTSDSNGKKSVNDLIGLLSEFQQELVTDEHTEKFSLGIGLNITGQCASLGKPIKAVSGGTLKSNVKLTPIKSDKKTLLIITPGLDKKLNKSSSEIVVANNVSFDAAESLTYGGKILDHTKLKNIDLTKYNAEIRLGSEFFTDAICVIGNVQNNPFPRALKAFPLTRPFDEDKKHVLLPIKKELLDYLTPDRIVDNFEVSYTENEEDIRVTLNLPINGFEEGNDGGQTITIEKIYHANGEAEEWKREIIDDLEPPLIQIWPNFVTDDPENWKAYYSYSDSLARNTFNVKLLDEGEAPLIRELDYGNFNAKLTMTEKFPKGYVCFKKYKTNIDEKQIDLGLILLRKPEKIDNGIKDCKIGIDFGTTNSIAYMSMDNNSPDIIRLKNRLYPVTEHVIPAEEREEGKHIDDTLALAELRRHFFTAKEQPNEDTDSISFRTLFNPNVKPFTNKLPITPPVFYGVVYFMDGVENIQEDMNISSLVQGKKMKWDDDEKSDNMRYFLLHLGLQCIAEAVYKGAKNIEIHYSYPKAFNKKQADDFSTMWDGIRASFKDISKLVVDKRAPKPESMAMAEFFKNKMAATLNTGMVCFDIGGGSTDIAIWQGHDGEPKEQCSIKFAGNDILNQQLLSKRAILRKLQTDQSLYDIIEDICETDDENDFNMKLEALLKYHEKKLFNTLLGKSVDNDVARFIRNISFALCGMFYYTGMLIGNLLLGRKLDNADLPQCFVGGNGSKLLNWVANGNYSKNHNFETIYATCLAVGIRQSYPDISEENLDPDMIDIRQSISPKEEVAYGLVCKTTIKDGSAKKKISLPPRNLSKLPPKDGARAEITGTILAGEKYYVNEAEGDGKLTVDAIHKGVKVKNEMPVFNEFIETYNWCIAANDYPDIYKIEFTTKELNDIRKQTNEALYEERSKDANKINLEPLFIIILKQALKCLTNKE